MRPAILALLVAGMALPPLSPGLEPPLWSPIPLEVGTWWEYRESYTEHLGAVDATTDETTRFEVRGTAARPFIHQTGGVDPASAPVERGEAWIRIGPWTGEDALPLPLEVGRAGPAPEGGRGWTVEAAEQVTVPGGTFACLRCALRTPRSVSILWIAPDVGVVLQVEGAPAAHPDIERALLHWGSPKGAASPHPLAALSGEGAAGGDCTLSIPLLPPMGTVKGPNAARTSTC